MAKTDKEEPVKEEKDDSFAALLALGKEMSKELKFDVLQVASEARLDVPRIPVGIFLMDYGMGGGVPVGLITIFQGLNEGGKTTTSLRAIASAQRMCRKCYLDQEDCKCKTFVPFNCVLIDAEGKFNRQWARHLGVDDKRLVITWPDHLEQMWDIADKLVGNKNLDFLVIDSLAVLASTAEVEKSAEENTVGIAARRNNSGLRKLHMSANRARNAEESRRFTVLVINQIRMKVGVMYGNPETTPGGMGQGFSAAVIVKLWAKKREMDSTTGRALTRNHAFRVEKNQTESTGGVEGEYEQVQAESETRKIGDVADEKVVATWAVKYGVIVPDEGKKNIFTWAGVSCNGIEQLADAILKNPVEAKKLKKKIMEVALKV